MSKHNERPSLATTLGIGGMAVAGALAFSPDARAQSASSEPVPPRQYIGEYMEALRPRLDDSERRSFTYDRRYQRFDVDDDTELGLGQLVRKGIERIPGVDFPDRWEWRVTDQDEYGDEIRGTGARLRIAIPLNPPERNGD